MRPEHDDIGTNAIRQRTNHVRRIAGNHVNPRAINGDVRAPEQRDRLVDRRGARSVGRHFGHGARRIDVHDVELPEGNHTLYVTADGEFDTVRIDGYDTPADLCITGMTLGLPYPGTTS